MTAATWTSRVPPGHYRFGQVARMEWIKLRTLRSVRWSLLIALAGMIGIGIASGDNTRNPRGDVTNNILAGVALGSLVFAVLGVLVMTSEYSSGTIRATLTAIPRRPLVLAAKASVFGVAALVTGELATFAGFLAGAAFVRAGVPHPALSQPAVLRAVAMSGAYLGLIGLIGLARARSSGTAPPPLPRRSSCCSSRRWPGSPRPRPGSSYPSSSRGTPWVPPSR